MNSLYNVRSHRMPYSRTDPVDLGMKYDKYYGPIGTLRRLFTSEGVTYAQKRAEYKRKQHFELPLARDKRDSPAPRIIADAPPLSGTPYKKVVVTPDDRELILNILDKNYGKHKRVTLPILEEIYHDVVFPNGVRLRNMPLEGGRHAVTFFDNKNILYETGGFSEHFPEHASMNRQMQTHGTCSYFQRLRAFYPETTNEKFNDAIDTACRRTGLTRDEVAVDIIKQISEARGVRKTDAKDPVFKKGGIIVAKKK